MAKPIHPATVHFPIAFLSLAYGLDIIYFLHPNLSSKATSYLPPRTDLSRASYYLLSLGLLSAIPAIVSGGQQAVLMISKQGMYEADGKTLKEKVKATFAHAIFNDIAIAASAYVWYLKRDAANNSLAGKIGLGSVAGSNAAAYAPDLWMVAAQAVFGGLLFFAASIGGALTYNYGVGFSAAKSGAKKNA